MMRKLRRVSNNENEKWKSLVDKEVLFMRHALGQNLQAFSC